MDVERPEGKKSKPRLSGKWREARQPASVLLLLMMLTAAAKSGTVAGDGPRMDGLGLDRRQEESGGIATPQRRRRDGGKGQTD